MHAHRSMRPAQHFARGQIVIRFLAALAVALAAIGLGSYSMAESPPPHPAAPDARVRVAPYRSVTSGYVSRRPVEPQPWRGRNDAVAPQEKK